MKIIKESKSLGKLTIKEIDYHTAKKITLENHYSKKWNTSFGKLNFGIFRNNKLLGVAVFGNLMNPKSYKQYGDFLKKENVLELNRMWISDELGKNSETILISSSLKIIKQEHPNVKIIQTFADGRLGVGTIYKASNFDYLGYHKTLFFENVETGEVYHNVPMSNTKRPKGMIKLNALFLQGKLKPMMVKTYKYIYVLDKKTRKNIDIKTLSYPKYEKGFDYLDDYKVPPSLVARFALMVKNLNKDYFDLAKKYMIENYGNFDGYLIEQRENESYKWFEKEYDLDNLKEFSLDDNKKEQTSIFDFL